MFHTMFKLRPTILCNKYQSIQFLATRRFAQVAKTEYASANDLSLLRNIGISAHIDSGKTTTTERILFYTGRIKEIHEVKGKDGVGAKMDSMDLEREKGITIKSAATHVEWGTHHINIIDTPGHVDFTIEVERSLQVLDGAIMLVCASSGIQSQTLTVDRQMKRYNVPRLIFINKCDRTGAKPLQVINDIREELGLNAALVQIPMGVEENHVGVIDIIEQKALYFDGPNGENIRQEKIPDKYLNDVATYRTKLMESLGEVNEEMEMHYLEEKFPEISEIKKVIRQCVQNNTFVPVFVGSAYKNKGIQSLLDGVINYLPSPRDKTHYAINPDIADENDPNYKVALSTDKKDSLLFYAFKLEENPFGQLTWCRVYQGTLKKGINITCNSGSREQRLKKQRCNRLVRLHSNEIQDISVAYAGDIVAMFGVECSSGTTFSDGKLNYVMTNLHIPETVVSLAVKPKDKTMVVNFTKAFERFMREDPTFKVNLDTKTGQCIFNGMGELHLNIYIERILREYGVECEIGKPRVNYKESITNKIEYDYLHKRQSGGQGEYARIIGYIEPLPGVPNANKVYEFVNKIRGTSIPPKFAKSVENGFKELIEKGPLIGGPIEGIKVVLTDGVTHEVDSNDWAFRNAAYGVFKNYFQEMKPRISEPYMKIEIMIPEEFHQSVLSESSSRGLIVQNIFHSGKNSTLKCYGSLDSMFGYATTLRSLTQGKGEFSMEYCDHQFIPEYKQQQLIEEYRKMRND